MKKWDEHLIRNPLLLKRWRRFMANKLAVGSLILLLIATFFSMTAEFWANSKPIVMKYQGSFYFPVVRDYHPTLFSQTDTMVTDYRALNLVEGDWAIWPLIAWDPYESNQEVESYPSQPTRSNWMGTDDRGRDVLSRLLYGFRYSLVYAVLVWLLCFAIGITVGGFMGYFGGRFDFWGQRVIEILSTVPQFFLLIIVISLFSPTLTLLVIISSIFGWISISYYVRGEFLKNRKMDFVEAARSLGAGHVRIVFTHVLPNSLGPVITFSPFVIAANMTALASLDYLGFGLTPPTPSWGELLNQAQKHFTIAWWLAVYPAGALFTSLVLLSLVGDGVRSAFDPKAR